MSPSDLEHLVELNNEIRECAKRRDVEGMTRAHNAFHSLVLECCGNQKIKNAQLGLKALLKEFTHNTFEQQAKAKGLH